MVSFARSAHEGRHAHSTTPAELMCRTIVVALVAWTSLLNHAVLASESCRTIMQILNESKELSTLSVVVNSTGLADALDDEEAEYTLFAPKNEAFDQLLVSLDLTLGELLQDTDMIRNGTLYHVVNGVIKSTDVAMYPDGSTLDTLLEGGTIVLNLSNLTVVPTVPTQVNIVDTDVMACGSVVHIIDAVMLPTAL